MTAVMAMPLSRLDNKGCSNGWLGLTIYPWQWHCLDPDLEVGPRRDWQGCLLATHALVQRRAIQTVFNPFPRRRLEPSRSECER